MYGNTESSRPKIEIRSASVERMKAIASHLKECKSDMEPHEYFGLINRAKAGLLPQDLIVFQSYLEGQSAV